VQWFSQPRTTPLALPTWFTSQYRYLDISALAQWAGWQLRAERGTLQITTPASAITGLRQGRQDWGDRVVVDLERPAPWRVVEENEGFTVAIDAAINPAILQSFVSTSGNRLRSLSVSANGNQTILRVSVPSGTRPYVWTLPDPSRVVIDVRGDAMVPRNIAWAPGIRWQQQYVNVGPKRFPVVSLAVNLRQPNVAVRPLLTNPGSATGISPLITMAQRWQVAAAINSGYFNRNNQLPLGAIRQDSKWVSGPILGRGAIAWNNQGNILIGRLSLQDTLITSNGQQFPVPYFNTGYVGAGVSVYSPDWGPTYTAILDNEVAIPVQADRVVRQQSLGAAGQGAIAIPPDGYLIVVRAYSEALQALPPGTGVARRTATIPSDFDRFPQIVGAGPLLVKNRQIVLNAQAEQFSPAFSQQSAARSVIGTTAEGTLIMAAIHSRADGPGPTLQEAAQIMVQLGAIDALNLDGGSSTSLYLSGQLVNRAPRTAARVHNGIGVFIQPGF
ncbi:MAG TPA: phosphodiester glycosidase family protein, partial [Chroococcidiopsis sp.]